MMLRQPRSIFRRLVFDCCRLSLYSLSACMALNVLCVGARSARLAPHDAANCYWCMQAACFATI
eukprot:scaffold546880_cov17-Prasinocladus_malaysianus.AAC.1